MAPSISLNDGSVVPQLGFGTLNLVPDRKETPESTASTAGVVRIALELGYRLVDTAQSYATERAVGLAIAASGLARGEVYVTSKVSNANHRPDDVRRSFDETMDKLGLEQLDLLLMHWPLPTLHGGDFVSTWSAMTALVGDGRLRSVGVSNFQPAHLERIIGETGIVPVVNQIEVHPYFRNDAARAASWDHGVAVEAWSPLGMGSVLGDPVIGRIAAAVGRSPAQVVLRWHLQLGHIVIPRSTRRERMAENLDVVDFELSDAEMAVIGGLDRGEPGRMGPHPDTFEGLVPPVS